MSDLEAQVGAILQKMVNATVTEMTKVIGVSDSTQAEVPPCATDTAQATSAEAVC